MGKITEKQKMQNSLNEDISIMIDNAKIIIYDLNEISDLMYEISTTILNATEDDLKISDDNLRELKILLRSVIEICGQKRYIQVDYINDAKQTILEQESFHKILFLIIVMFTFYPDFYQFMELAIQNGAVLDDLFTPFVQWYGEETYLSNFSQLSQRSQEILIFFPLIHLLASGYYDFNYVIPSSGLTVSQHVLKYYDFLYEKLVKYYDLLVDENQQITNLKPFVLSKLSEFKSSESIRDYNALALSFNYLPLGPQIYNLPNEDISFLIVRMCHYFSAQTNMFLLRRFKNNPLLLLKFINHCGNKSLFGENKEEKDIEYEIIAETLILHSNNEDLSDALYYYAQKFNDDYLINLIQEITNTLAPAKIKTEKKKKKKKKSKKKSK